MSKMYLNPGNFVTTKVAPESNCKIGFFNKS